MEAMHGCSLLRIVYRHHPSRHLMEYTDMKQPESYQSRQTTLSRNALATFCAVALITAASAAVAADRTAPGSSWKDGSRGAESRITISPGAGTTVRNDAYPDTETMLQMYHAARKDGRLDAGMSTEYPTLPILKAAYRLLSEPGASRGPLQGEALGQPTAGPLFQTKAATCRSETLSCLAQAAAQGYDGTFTTRQWARLFACSLAAAGRNQDSPKISADCTDILEVSAVCANANDLCGVVPQPVPTAGSFVGSSANAVPTTLTCGNLTGAEPKDRIIQLGTQRRTINGVERITRMRLMCTTLNSAWVGTATTSGTVEYRDCKPNASSTRAIEGATTVRLTEGGLRTVRLRCDHTTSADPGGDIYAPVMADTAGAGGDALRAECQEGEFAWGLRVYVNTNAPADKQYITGYNFICRK